jgi:hypothetical protein
LNDNPCYVAFDCEWTKNFRIKNGNRPFCFSLVAVPITSHLNEDLTFSLAYAYIDSLDEESDLVVEANCIVEQLLNRGHIFVGHQLSSDLAALLNLVPNGIAPGLTAVREAWRTRRESGAEQRVIDTRYDMSSLLRNKSRRLVDVCQELELLVTQPELGHASMTALQRQFLQSGKESLRERLQVMNIRHSLSTAILAMLADGKRFIGPINVNVILFNNLSLRFGYLQSPMFRALL